MTNKAEVVRDHFLDAARAFCMLLGIPFHAALIYAPANWRIHSADTSEIFEYLVRLIHCFRMPAFFVISGFFAVLLLSRRETLEWVRTRTIRLWVPFFCGLIFLNTMMLIFEKMAKVPERTLAPAEIVDALVHPDHPIAHLWFLPVLFWLSLALVCGQIAFGRMDRLIERPEYQWLTTSRLGIGVAIAILSVWQVGIDHILFNAGMRNAYLGIFNISLIMMYFPYFMFGALLFFDRDMFRRFTTFTPRLGVAAAISVTILLIMPSKLYGITTPKIVAETVCGATLIRFLFAIMARYFDYPNRLIQSLVNKSFSIYLVHMPVIFGLGYIGLLIGGNPFIQWAAITAITIMISVFFAYIVEKSALLKFMFNGIWTYPAKRAVAV